MILLMEYVEVNPLYRILLINWGIQPIEQGAIYGQNQSRMLKISQLKCFKLVVIN